MARVAIPGVTFDEANFRTVIKQTMGMGMPEDTTKQLTWHWLANKTYLRPDPANAPYDWTAAPTASTPGNPAVPGGSLVVDYAIEFQFSARGGTVETELGEFDQGRAIVTLLDVDYEQIKTADYVTIDEARYNIDFTAPPMGMFGVTVYTVYLTAIDES